MIFALDSSGNSTLLGLQHDGQTHELLLPDRDCLKSSFLSLLSDIGAAPMDLTAVAIGSGPGSFTGLRVGFAFAHGLARGLDISLWPVPSFEVFARNLLPKHNTVVVLARARRDRWFAESFGAFPKPRTILGPADLKSWLPLNCSLCGPGCATLPDDVLRELEPSRHIAEERAHVPHADALIALAVERWKDRDPLKIGDVLPDYGIDFGAN